MKKKATSQSSAKPNAAQAFANPEAIIEHIEEESNGVPPHDPYRTRIETLMGRQFKKDNYDAEAYSEAKHLREMRGGIVLEEMARHAGFVLGFEYCRDLLLSGALVKGRPR